MKYLVLFIFSVLLCSCASTPKFVPGMVNYTIIDEKTGKSMLWGQVNREAFGDTAFSSWFSQGYNTYKPDAEAIQALAAQKDYTVTVVFGTWCSDSRDHVPHFMKVADASGLSSERIMMIAVDRKKTDPMETVKNLNIKLVPTFIFFRNGIELGRIIEVPEDAIEKVMLSFVR